MSLLEDYLLTSQDSLESCLMRIKGNENRIEVLRRLIEKTEKLHDTTEERRQPFIEAISDDVEMKNGEGYSMVSGSEPAMPASTENHKATGKRGGSTRWNDQTLLIDHQPRLFLFCKSISREKRMSLPIIWRKSSLYRRRLRLIVF
jgi:hypothetical protein